MINNNSLNHLLILAKNYEQYKRDLAAAKEETQRWANSLNQLSFGMAETFADSFSTVIYAGKDFGYELGQIFVDLAKQIVSAIVKAALLASILSLTGLGGVAMASGGIFSKGTGFSDIFQGIIGGAFANGGQPPVGKMSLVGERGPELFVPGSSGTIIPNHALGGGGAAAIPDVRISGDDLLIVFDRANRRKQRR